ncbi:MAG TPA: FtsK/SpoIIIE domain-containing protein, partial [Ornithinibacter sp.]|nr:FtsK/SpoIIIE domain-containing protein [Ornithinibacter sp.]
VDVVIDAVGPWWADRVARALAPLRSAEGGVGSLPRSISLSQAVAADLSPPALAARWRARARSGTPTAVVGVTADGLFSIDLVHDGPHVLIGGTTGSGKSEFLRTLVTSLALACPPEDLTFVLVDFKGGAAFGPCASLPHVVGLVTDLDEHLVSRALRSLGAELRRRERIFATVGASDLEGYHRAQGPGTESVPRLVIVIDELKALVDEVPDFVSGLVRLAALGRSLGVHLVLATQRPSGAVTAEIQANVNLRIAFRVRDRTDSVDILEDPAAAGVRSSTPGRALSRGGDGILVMFQAATLSDGDSAAEPFLRVSAPDVQEDARMPAPSVHAVTPLVDAARRAHALRGGAAPRTPWLPPLPDLVHPVSEPSIPAHDPAPRATIGLVDEPEHQQVSPLVWTPGDGSWLLSGRPGSGRTTALRTLVLSLARRLPSDRLHIHVIDPSAALADLEALPHVGTRLTPTRRRSLAALIVHLRHEVEVRRSTPDQATDAPLVVLVIDGWEQFTEAQGALDPEGVVDAVLAILRDGSSVGVVGVVAGGRGLLQPRWSAIGGTTLLLGAVDPLDAALVGLRLADVPRDPPRGRAVRLADRREVQITLSMAQDSCEVAAHASRGGTGRSTDAGQPWAWRDLP